MQGEGLGGSADPITLSSAACMPHAHQVSGHFGPRDTQQSSGGAPGSEVSQAVAIASASRFLRLRRRFSSEVSQAVANALAARSVEVGATGLGHGHAMLV